MKKLVIFIVLAISAEISAQVKELPIKTSVDGVTIFMNGAQVFRSKTIDITQGSNVLKFTGLSPYVDPKSVQVKVKGGVMVMSVNHQFNYTDSIARSKELDELSSKLRSVDSKIQLESVNSEIINDELEFLKENRNVGAKGQVVTLAGLKEVATYYSERVTALKMKQIDISKRIETLSLERNALQNQINQVSGKKSDPMSEVVVKMNAPAQTKCEVELSYYVNNAGWFPTYDIRSKSTNDPIEIMYKANIHQNTKEEWNNVKIKLSSSNPKTGGVAPQLKPYLVDYYLVPPRYENLFSILSGKIIASDDNSPIPGATISVKNSTIKTMSDANGNYSISIPSVGSEIEVSFVGFDPKTIRATTPNIDIVLTPSTLMLQEVAGSTIRGNSTVTAKNKALAEPLQIPVNIQEAQTSV
ncbi:MAG: mucoidy inhibitor MuiA family protein, partial [Bacteroidales bacterium]